VALNPGRLSDALDAIDPAWRASNLCVAVSGGLDSSVLLHAAAAVVPGARLRAVHVNHGLQSGSGAWAEACRATCAAAGIPLDVLALRLAPAAGESVEAAARAARYAAIAAQLGEGEWLLTAQHRDDQLETVLIQLLRGAGVAGLAAMPARARLGRGWLARPLLGVERAELAAYAARNALAWHEDPMNESLRLDRGWLRARVLPALRERWPAASATVARSAAHLAEASRLLSDVAAGDAAGVIEDGRVGLAGLAMLSRDRQVNLLRWWLREEGLRPPPAARLASALPAFLAARRDGAPMLRWDGGEVRRYRGRLYAMPVLAEHRPDPAPATASVDLGAGLGRFELVAGDSGGIRMPFASRAELRFRAGGETLRTNPGRPRKRLKDLCREAGIVPWMRDRLPLVVAGGQLVAVGDLWIESDLAAAPGDAALKPVWSGRPRIY
jgi:tRNA(Ile)-lysidine synthase